jgi:hypothetical protein
MSVDLREHTTNVGDHLGAAVLVLEVKWRSPVGGLVLSDATGSAVVLFILALSEVLVGGVCAKVCGLSVK